MTSLFSKADRASLVDQLKRTVVEVDFVKVNGEQRTMRCTLREDMLPPVEKPVIDLTKPEKKTRVGEDAVSVFDLDKKDWRSFRIDSIICWTVRN